MLCTPAYLRLLLLLVIVTGLFTTCKKVDPNEGLEPPRVFKPSGISIKTTATSATVTWAEPILSTGQPLSYTIEFSQDSTFATNELSLTADSLTATVTDENIAIRKKYFARVKANAFKDQPESKWETSQSFAINGEQLFFPIREVELNETTVTLRWTINPDLTKIILAIKEGSPIEHVLTADELTNGFKVITGLLSDTAYTAELFMGEKSKGLLNFSTPAPIVYTTILNAGDDLASAISAAADNAVIGLSPGTYDAGGANFILLQKTITIRSTSNNPLDTKINFKEFTLRGTGAGINLVGVELDGTPAGALYFINLTGVSADAELANYTQVTINNCIVHGAATSFLRANRGANAGDYKMNQVVVRNALVYDIGASLSYNCFHLDKLELNTMHVSNSTFYNFGQALASSSTVLVNMPTITFDYCTLNNFGGKNKYALMDANANPVKFNITNSIVANTPLAGQTVPNVAIRGNGAGTSMTYSNNNTFGLTNGSGTALTMPTANITQVGNNTINLGWTAATTDFTLPAGSVLRTVSNVGTAIGDPRWTY